MIIARVNDYEIEEKEFRTELNRLLKELNRSEANTEMKEKALDNLIIGALILQEARLQNIQISEDEVQQEMINFQMKFGTSEEYEAVLSWSGLTHEQMLQKIHDKLLVRQYLEGCVTYNFEVDEQYLQDFYEHHINLFKTELMIRVSHILTT